MTVQPSIWAFTGIRTRTRKRWALRCNPSSGNLHPTEAYVLCPRLPGLAAGVYHYLSRDHVLEKRAAVDDPRWTEAFSGNGVLIGISSIYWREAWKYGMRAWRYCQHDCGHAVAAVSYAAAALGWQSRMATPAADEVVAGLLGLGRSADFESAEAEAPDALLWVGDPDAQPDALLLGDAQHVARGPRHEQLVLAAMPTLALIDSCRPSVSLNSYGWCSTASRSRAAACACRCRTTSPTSA